MESIIELRKAYEQAEKEQRAAYRRATWLERRLFCAADENEYERLNAELEAQEDMLNTLSAELI